MWTQDETRLGLIPIHRQRITAKGVQPKISAEIKREYYYLVGLIEALTGQDFMLELPSLETQTRQIFMDEFAREDPASLQVIILANASSHTTAKMKVAENLRLLFLPAHAPELNPIERFWRELKDWLSDYQPATLNEVRDLVSQGLKSFSEKALSSITSFDFLISAWLSAIA